MLKFCTLFNTTYLSRGIAMYNSLEQHAEDFHLYIFAFDDYCFDVLTKMALKNASIISLYTFENDRLLAIKDDRTAGEYCWTCASSTIKYCIEKYALDHCTYIDADLLFFSNPACLVDEMGEKSVLITEHRYTPCYDQSVTSGVYCVQFMTFKNTQAGMEVLNWWVDACIEWCFNRFEDNKFGDQKYLDDWTTRFDTVHVLKNIGGGVAPWNVQQYEFTTKEKQIKGKELDTQDSFDLVFYHFHDFQYITGNAYRLSSPGYYLHRKVARHIYKPYTKALSVAEAEIYKVNAEKTAHELSEDNIWIKLKTRKYVLFTLLGYYKNFHSKRSLEYGFLSMRTFRFN